MREFVGVHVEAVDVDDDARQAAVASIVLSRPPTNAFTRQVHREIVDASAEVARRDDVAAVIVFGGHAIFSAGQDPGELHTLDADEAEQAARISQQAVDAVAGIPKPTVAAITGYALGGGLTLALAADWRVSGDNVKFGATEILAGRVPVDGAGRLSETVGVSKAKDMVFSGRFVDAAQALAVGLVDDVVAPDLVYDSALTWARRFLGHPPAALAAAKAAFARR